MRPIHHREPGPIVALMEDPRVTVETDHRRCAPAPGALPGRDARTSDPTGSRWSPTRWPRPAWPTERTGSGRWPSTSLDGVARVAGTDTIAGSTATMDQVFRLAVTNSGRPRDQGLKVAVRQASINPARRSACPTPPWRPAWPRIWWCWTANWR